MKKIYMILAVGLLAFAPARLFDNTAQTLPFTQNWTVTSLITTDDDWSGVPGIEGYLGQDITTGTGVDPQTLLSVSGLAGDLDVNAQSLATSTTGGVLEVDGIADPTIALQGSGTADAPYMLINLNTTGLENITVEYILRDLDESADDAVQQFALQYRIGNSGNFTNVPAGYVADATTANTATQVTPVSAVLPAACDDESLVQVRIITSNATGNDELVGVDDINIYGTTIVIGNSNNSDIIADAGFTAPSNVNYLLYQATDISTGNSLEVARFILQDGGGAADADAVGTTLTDLIFNLSNAANVRRVALYDGLTELAEVAGNNLVIFSGLNIVAADNGTKSFSLRVTFNTAVTDNQRYSFNIISAASSPAGSGFASSNAGGATSSLSGDDNRIEVVADRLAYQQNTTSPTGLNVAMTPAVRVRAIDVNNNVDLDFTESIRITSTGTLAGAPVNVAAVAGVAIFSTLTHTAPGTGLTLIAERTSTMDWDIVSNPFNIQVSSSATDYFRSVATGNWNATGTWESSADNSTWVPATLVPNQNANTITIQNGHTITVSTNVTADQVVIENGGELTNTGAVLTVNNGTGDDIIVQGGGVLTLAITGSPVYSASATANINTGGILRISRTGYTGNGTGMNSANYVYQNGAIAEYTLTSAFTTSNVTYFPNVDDLTVPIFRTTGNLTGIGSGNPTVFKGIFEANSNVTFGSSGFKTFRNGIRGTGNVSGASSGKFIINGLIAELGGAGSLTAPASGGIEIGSIVTLTNDKTITGNVSLLTDSYIELGANNLTVTGIITGGSTSAYIRTNGTGELILNIVGALGKTFPIGNASYNPLIIENGSNLNWSVKVNDGLTSVPTDKAVLLRWDITPSVNPPGGGADITFQFDETTQVGPSFSTVTNVQAWRNVGTWIPSGVPASVNTAVPGAATVKVLGLTGFSGYALANVDGPLPVKFSNVKAYQQGSGIKVEWSNLTESNVADYKVERSVAGQTFAALTTVLAAKNDGGRADYSFIDALPVNGVNLYRIRATEADGQKLYSVIVRVDTRGGITTITVYPNPVTAGQLSLQATELPKGLYNVQVYNAAGQQVHSQQLNHNGGSVTEMIQLPASLRSGMYNLFLSNGEVKLGKTFIVR